MEKIKEFFSKKSSQIGIAMIITAAVTGNHAAILAALVCMINQTC